MDLLDHMGDKELGVTGTIRKNMIYDIPFPTQKEVEKNFKRGVCQAVYTTTNTVIVWKDNKPVYMASNCDGVEPMGTCQKCSKQEKGYIAVPQPSVNSLYNQFMGGVDLIDNAQEN